MAESKDSNEDSDSLLKEEFAHVEELLISSREECIDIGNKYQDLNSQVQELIKYQEGDDASESVSSDHSETHREIQHNIEEQLLKYESQITVYQHTQSRQAEIVGDLQSRVEEYRRRCAKLEAALAEQKVHETSIEVMNMQESEFQAQNVFSMDLETALIRLEQEKNRCQGLTEINNLLREQLETATEVNQTLTSDVHRLTKEWQHARSELLAKETEWKEEEQTFNMYFTKESNILLSLWRQILNFRHDFANLRSSTERDLSSFKVCICQTIQNVMNVETLQETDSSLTSDILADRSSKSVCVAEKVKLQERISDLIERNEKIQWLLDEKEKVNSALHTTIEKINSSFKTSTYSNITESKDIRTEKICSEYLSVIQNLSELLQEDPKSEVLPSVILNSYDASFLDTRWETFTDENISKFHSIVSNVKNTFKKYSKQLDEANLKLSSVQEQNSMQQRTIEFLEDEREKMQKLNVQLSTQFESIHQKVQGILGNGPKSVYESEENRSSCIDAVVKSLSDQVDSMNSENSRLLTVQQELQSKLQNVNEEKRKLILSEQNLKLEANKNLRKISVLERNMDSLRKDYLQTQEILQQTTLDKELLEEEKIKFSSVLSNLEKQCFDLKNCLQQLKDEESIVKDSLVTLQTMSETLSVEKNDLSQYLNDATAEIGRLKEEQSQERMKCENEKSDLKSEIDNLKEKCLELETENEQLQKSLQDIESTRLDIEEEKSQINLYNTDLTNQITKYSTQKKNIEAELEKVREELKHQLELSEKINSENNSLLRSKTELSMKLETVESEMNELNDIILELKEEKINLEKTLLEMQKTSSAFHEEKNDLLRDLDYQKSSVSNLQAQIKELQELHKKYVDDTAIEKHTLIMKMQEIEQEFQVSLKNEQHQHNIDIDILTQEKESLRGRLVSAVDELLDSHQKQQEELISAHQEEVAALKKQLSSLETECEEKIELEQNEKRKVENEYRQQISSLENAIKKLKEDLAENDCTISTLEEKVFQFEKGKQEIMQESLQTEQKLRDEINDIILENSKSIEDLEGQVKDLKQLKESAEQELSDLQGRHREMEIEKNRIVKELEEINSYLKDDKGSRTDLEDKIALLHNQLSDEKNLNEVINKSLDDCKQRLKLSQAENIELKTQIEEANQQLSVIESNSSKKHSQNIELKNTLRDVENSRLELKREVSNLKKKLSVLESTLKVREQEITELTALHNKDEVKKDELRKEIISLKQKLMESSASTEALQKEMMNSKQKLSGMEHKLKMQQEQHHSVLQESLTNEQTLSEYRLNLERSMVDATKEIQKLRSLLNLEEGKVLALESRVVKLDGAKRDVENKLYSICLFLRSALGLSSDSGFLSTTMPFSPVHSQRSTPERPVESSRSSIRESPHRLNFSKSSSHAEICITDHDIELLKSTLMDMMEKYSSIEKDKDGMKDSFTNLQQREEELRTEHSRCIAKIYQLKRDLEDKKNVEKDIATKIASIHHHEEVIRTLEREKRRLTEKVGNLDFSLSAVTKEKEGLLDKMEEMKKSIYRYEQEMKTVVKAKESAETKAAKYYHSYQYGENDISSLKDTLASKEIEIRSLEHNLQTLNKKFLAAENRNKTLQATVDKLNSAIEKHIDNEKLLQQKVTNLTSTLSYNSASQQNFYQEIEKIGKERLKYQHELAVLQQSLDQARNSADEYRLKNKILTEEVEDLKRNLNQSQTNDDEKIKHLQNIVLKAREQERESSQQVNQLQTQKVNLEKKIIELSSSLRECKENILHKEENCLTLEKEKKSLQKALDKIEREKQKTSEETARFLLEKSSLGRSLTKLEIENAALQEKVQNLQAQLAELEERHAQRVKDFLKSQSIESKLEDERLRTALKQTEQLMEAREKTHRQRVLGLEERIAVLKSHLEREKLRWQQYHQRSYTANANINYLHSVLSKSLQNVSEDPQKLLPEAERLDLTTEVELSASPGVTVSTPSKLSPSAAHVKTSTPKAKKRLDLSPDS